MFWRIYQRRKVCSIITCAYTPLRACERSVSGKKSRSTLKALLEPPLSAPFPLRNSPLRAPLKLHRFLWPPLTAPFPLTQFSARSAPVSAPLTLHLFSIAIMSYLFPEISINISILIIVISK